MFLATIDPAARAVITAAVVMVIGGLLLWGMWDSMRR